ncbi:hypothetical protein IQ230_10600 [Gloeocapsopsis crepidinum LEGE 06123]|uniref:Uncharacterized protein n=1 Tax=Gloeocapsopsis crepidinum LEGE 06123 TaxID=588587 RepID=A0ABR9UR95_9CHRO|nr:hypothetical protein [Gloeocapsopsis crepidinum]MBE9190796.1 hypothetical protein [Gloeocapsopsis crepidinum LEGE 06123]
MSKMWCDRTKRSTRKMRSHLKPWLLSRLGNSATSTLDALTKITSQLQRFIDIR